MRRNLQPIMAVVLAGLAVSPGLVGCQNLAPRVMEPPIWKPLKEPLLDGTLGVRTLAEARPGPELGERMINHWMSLEPISPHSRYWQFHEGMWGNLGASSDHALGGVRARYTGLASFEWIPFPWVGTVVSEARPANEGISDFLAAILDRRRLARRVVRIHDGAQNERVDFVLEGRLEHFAGILAELEPTADLHLHPGSDLLLAGRSSVTLALRDAGTGEEIWGGTFDANDDLVTIDEPIAANVPTDYDRTYTIFSDHFDRWALESMQERGARSLVDLCRKIVGDMETVLAPGEPEVPIPDVFTLPEPRDVPGGPVPPAGGGAGETGGGGDTLFGQKIQIPREALESERKSEDSRSSGGEEVDTEKKGDREKGGESTGGQEDGHGGAAPSKGGPEGGTGTSGN